MKYLSLDASLALGIVLSLTLTGCNLLPGMTADRQGSFQITTQTASMDLKLDWARGTQALSSEITDATLSVKVSGKAPYQRAFKYSDITANTLHLDGLPTGDATIRMEVARGAEPFGSGTTYAPLVAGRRTSVMLIVSLESRGETNLRPFTPLGPVDLASAFASQLIGIVDDGALSGRSYEINTNWSNYLTVSGDMGQALFTNLTNGPVQLQFGSDYNQSVAYAVPKAVQFAMSDPATVSATQSAIPTATLNVGWDFTYMQPQPNTVLASRTVDLSWPAKPGVDDPKYIIEIYGSTGTNTPFQSLETSAQSVRMTLNDNVQAGTRYLVLKYKRGSGTYGGRNAYGRSQAIPLIVPAP